MGFRFQRRISLIPGLRLNLSKSGVSLSAGGRGLTTNLSSSGLRTTIGIPGTGLSYRTGSKGSTARKKKAEPPKAEKPIIKKSERKEVFKQPDIPRRRFETKSSETPKGDLGESVNGILSILEAIAALFGLVAGILNFIGRFAPKQAEEKAKNEPPVIDVDATTVSQEQSLDIPTPIVSDSGRYPQTDEECTRLATEKPKNWEWRLVLQLMKIRFESLRKDWEDATWGRTPTRAVKGDRQPAVWSDFMLNQIQEIGSRLKDAYGNEELIIKAFGPSGEPGNAEQIVVWMNGVCGELGACVDWELEIQTLKSYPDGSELMAAMTGWTSALLNPFYDLCAQMHQKLEIAGQSQQLDMSIQLGAPQVDRFNELLPGLSEALWKSSYAPTGTSSGEEQSALPPILKQQT